jgi:hypothetical protein
MIRAIFIWLIAPEEAFIGLTIKREPKMSSKMQDQIAKSHEQALGAFIAKKAEIDAMLTRLQALSDDQLRLPTGRCDLEPPRHTGALCRAAQADHRQCF